MNDETQWREALACWWGSSFVFVYDPERLIDVDAVYWQMQNPVADADDEVLELAEQLAMLKKSNKN